MKCHKAQLLINKLLDGELQEADYHRLKAHLANCPKCCQIYEDWQAIKSVARASSAGEDRPEPTSAVWEKLKDSLEAEIIPGLKEKSEIKSKREQEKKPFQWLQLPGWGWRYGVALFIVLIMMAGSFFPWPLPSAAACRAKVSGGQWAAGAGENRRSNCLLPPGHRISD